MYIIRSYILFSKTMHTYFNKYCNNRYSILFCYFPLGVISFGKRYIFNYQNRFYFSDIGKILRFQYRFDTQV